MHVCVASDLCCSHIFIDKTYYIDPNGGSTLDAMEVVCRKFETEEGIFTCIKPTIHNIVSACTVYGCCLAMVMTYTIKLLLKLLGSVLIVSTFLFAGSRTM